MWLPQVAVRALASPSHPAAIAALVAALAVTGCAVPHPPAGPGRPFDFERDTFAFANETVWHYANGRPAPPDEAADDAERYTRRCFLLSEAALQFWKAARFDGASAPLSREELAKRVREIRRFRVWHDSPPSERRVVIPGYADLRELSQHEGGLLRRIMGPGWITFFDPRKLPLPFSVDGEHQDRLNHRIETWLDAGHPITVWIYNYPRVNINHSVVAYARTEPSTPGRTAYLVMDPNDTQRPRRLEYDPERSQFFFEETFYFPGGTVTARPMYLGPLR